MTEMLYYSYEGNFLMECDAEITQCVILDDNTTTDPNNNNNDNDNRRTVQLALNQTVLHAQGGGQPTDRGIIQRGDMQVHVTKILLDRQTKVAMHTGTIMNDVADGPTIAVGDKVKVFVDKENRLILSECHTAGHVIDAAMAKCGLLPGMETSKAYHL
jgi:Ser-tRNA(Ala) deacylase AlaX